MKKTDDYDLYEKDFNEFIRRGLDAFGLDDKTKTKNGRDEHAIREN